MRHKLLSWPIRAHLTILIVLLAVPSVALIVYSGITERNAAIEGAGRECLKTAESIGGRQQAMVAGAEQLAVALSALPQIQSRNSVAVSAFLSEIIKRNPAYANIVVGDKSGLVWASAMPFQGKLYMADRKYYRDAMRTGTFSSGEYNVGKISSKPMINFGYPIKNASNQLIGVIGIGLDLGFAQRVFDRAHLPAGASFSLLDHRGVILSRNNRDALTTNLIGRRDTLKELFTGMKGQPEEAAFEAMGNDGNFKLGAYKRLRLLHETEPYMYVRVSIPHASAISAANAATFRNLAAFASLFLIGLLLAWFVGKSLIVNPVKLLKKASEQLAEGADAVDVSRSVKGGEFGELARTFDGMADALVRRRTALAESEERYRTTVTSIGDAVITTDEKGRVNFLNRVAEGLTGWTHEEAAGRPLEQVFSIINELTRKSVQNPVDTVLREGHIVGLANHTSLLSRDGRDVPIEDSAAPIRNAAGGIVGVVLVFHDVTEKRKALNALRESEMRFRLALRNAPVAVSVQDRDLRYIWEHNQRTAPSEGIVGRLDSEIFTPEEAEKITALKRRVLDEDIELREQMWFDRRAGRIFLDVYWEPIHDEDGRVVGVGTATVNLTPIKLAEEALKESKARLDLALRSAEMGAWHWDIQDDKRYFDDQVCRLLGIDPTTFTGTAKEFFDTVHPDDREKLRSALSRTIEENVLYEPEYRAIRPDGTVRHIAARGTLVRDDSGRPLRINGIIWDITEHKVAEEDLRRAHDELELRVQERTAQVRQAFDNLSKERQRLYDVLETLPAMVCLLTPDYQVPFANKAFREHFGEANGRKCFDYCFGRQEPCEFCESFKVFQTGQPLHWEVNTPDGRVIDAYDFPFTDVDGSPLILEMDRDITEQRRMEKALRLAFSYNRSLIEASLDPLVTIDPEGRITDVNAATERATGLSREELIGTDFSGYFTEPRKARAGYRMIFNEGLVRDYPLDLRHKDGHSTPVLYNASVYRDEAGKIAGVFAAARDISEQQRLASQLRQSQKMDALGVLSGGIAHDFNNILAIIIGFAEIARDKSVENEAAAKALSRVCEAGIRGREIVKQMLTFSRKVGAEEEAPPVIEHCERIDQTPACLHTVHHQHQAGRGERIGSHPGRPRPGPAGAFEPVHQRRPSHDGKGRHPGSPALRFQPVGWERGIGRGQARHLYETHRLGYRHRYFTREHRQDIRPLLHHKEAGGRHRAGPFRRPRHRKTARRVYNGRKRTGKRLDVYCLFTQVHGDVPRRTGNR